MIEDRRRHHLRAGIEGGSGEQERLSPLRGRRMKAGEARERLVLIGCRSAAVAAMARFLKLWAGQRLDVTLVEPSADIVASRSLPHRPDQDSGSHFPYDRRGLTSRYGIRVVDAAVSGIDPVAQTLTLADGSRLDYDRISAAPGRAPNFPAAVV